jgi:hypothetical protein
MSTPPSIPTTPTEKQKSSDENARHGLQIEEAEVASHAPSLRGRSLTAAVAFVAGTGFTLFGCVMPCDFSL